MNTNQERISKIIYFGIGIIPYVYLLVLVILWSNSTKGLNDYLEYFYLFASACVINSALILFYLNKTRMNEMSFEKKMQRSILWLAIFQVPIIIFFFVVLSKTLGIDYTLLDLLGSILTVI